MQVFAAYTGGGKQDARGDATIGHVLSDLARPIEDPCAQKRLSGLRAPGVTGGGYAAAVEAAAESGDSGLDGVELVEDAREIRDALGPDRREHRVIEPETVPT